MPDMHEEASLWNPFVWAYLVIQWFIETIFAPNAPAPQAKLVRPRIAVIGAGITGVASATHVVGHGFDVRIFEGGPRKNLGGIWSRVNSTSGLQIHSIMYRFHPSVKYREGYPGREEIVGQVEKLWKRYGLEDKTKFDCKVNKVYKDSEGRWIINDPSNGLFDGVIAAVGTCGDGKMPHIDQQENFKGEIIHSSGLDGRTAEGKKVVIIGGGASAVEALEFVTHTNAKMTTILARSDKWIIPRNWVIDTLLAFNILGQETILSWIPESLLRIFFYRDLQDLAPTHTGLFTGTPMVNSDVFEKIRDGKAEWLRGDIIKFTKDGIIFNKRNKNVPKGGQGHQMEVKADMVIMATGYHRPSLSFLPDDTFEEDYTAPAWYLQVFPPKHVDICANNCTYQNAIGTVGNWHIGIYTRLLLVFLVDPLARPQEYWMKRWIDMTRFLKSRSPEGAFDFFTYSELIYWFIFCILINPFRWKWAPFVLYGFGSNLPLTVVQTEDKIRERFGYAKSVNGKRD